MTEKKGIVEMSQVEEAKDENLPQVLETEHWWEQVSLGNLKKNHCYVLEFLVKSQKFYKRSKMLPSYGMGFRGADSFSKIPVENEEKSLRFDLATMVAGDVFYVDVNSIPRNVVVRFYEKQNPDSTDIYVAKYSEIVGWAPPIEENKEKFGGIKKRKKLI